MNNPIEVNDLSYQYENNSPVLLKKVNLTVSKGEILAIVGLSGIGKSTLCYCLSGIIPHVYGGVMAGDVLLNGTNTKKMTLPQIATTLGIVFQNPDNQLFSPSVEDEIAFGPENLCVPQGEIKTRINEVLATVGMESFRHAGPHHLSGGQKQLIALASVLSLKPDIIIYDEAMSQIDAAGKVMIKEMLLKLKSEGKTAVMVEHDFDNLDIADRVMMLKNGTLVPYEGALT
ncbi:MAG: energy-coupling factor ABC transporter ATP-binding protein [Firmicutes bacterium]|nr:energy-coupling factor ABC transporter ATP-binding protein [Bacillota bacterium]